LLGVPASWRARAGSRRKRQKREAIKRRDVDGETAR
jgi:hypothetical protein